MTKLSGSTVVILGGTSGIGLETARQTHAADAKLILTGRDPGRLAAARDARECATGVRSGGSLTFLTGTHAPRPGDGLILAAIVAAALPVITANATVELAPVRVNAIGAGFVDTPLSSRLLGNEIDRRWEKLRGTLSIRRVVGPADVAALALHLMTNTALTGATYDVDGGQQLIA